MQRRLTLLKSLALVGLLCLWLAGCAREPLYQSQGYVFGTLVEVSIYGEPETRARELADHVLQDFQRLHDRLHAWQPGSDLYRLNEAFAAGRSEPVSNELTQLIGDAAALSTQSGGLFNPAIGNLIRQWGFQRAEFAPVRIEDAAIAALVAANPRMHDIVIDNGQAHSRNPAVRVDLGGYAKGYALDRAAAYLRGQGVHDALVNIGGNIIALGRHGDRPWRVGIQHPREPGPIATLDLPGGWAIGTSGDYQRFFQLDGKRYCHIIDPRTGFPAQDTRSVTVLVPPGPHAGVLSDAASKPIFIAEPQRRLALAQAMGIADFMLIDGQGRAFASTGMAQRLHWEKADAAPQILR